MGYYDSVKEDVSESQNDNSGGAPGFDTLKQEAERNESPEDGDDTPIEVLDDGLDSKDGRRTSRKDIKSEGSKERNSVESKEEENFSDMEERLDRMIEQNRRIIQILESFGD